MEMDFDVLNRRINELLEELGERSFDDPKRQGLVEEVNTLTRLSLDAEKREADRISQYTQNDINQQRVLIDEERIKTDRANSKRELFGRIFQTSLTVLGSIGLAIASFKGEWLMNVLKDRTIWDIAKSLKPRS